MSIQVHLISGEFTLHENEHLRMSLDRADVRAFTEGALCAGWRVLYPKPRGLGKTFTYELLDAVDPYRHISRHILLLVESWPKQWLIDFTRSTVGEDITIIYYREINSGTV